MLFHVQCHLMIARKLNAWIAGRCKSNQQTILKREIDILTCLVYSCLPFQINFPRQFCQLLFSISTHRLQQYPIYSHRYNLTVHAFINLIYSEVSKKRHQRIKLPKNARKCHARTVVILLRNTTARNLCYRKAVPLRTLQQSFPFFPCEGLGLMHHSPRRTPPLFTTTLLRLSVVINPQVISAAVAHVSQWELWGVVILKIVEGWLL